MLQRLFDRRYITSHQQLYRYFRDKCSDELHLLVPPGLTFTAKTHHVMRTVAKNLHSLHLPLLGCQFHSTSFFPRVTACRTNSQEVVFQITPILTWSRLVLTVIFHAYPHWLCLLIFNPISRLTLGLLYKVNRIVRR